VKGIESSPSRGSRKESSLLVERDPHNFNPIVVVTNHKLRARPSTTIGRNLCVMIKVILTRSKRVPTGASAFGFGGK